MGLDTGGRECGEARWGGQSGERRVEWGRGERRGRRGRSESSCAVEKEEGTVSYAPLLITTADAQAP